MTSWAGHVRPFCWPRHPAWHQLNQDNMFAFMFIFSLPNNNHMHIFLHDLVPDHNDFPLLANCSCASPIGYGPRRVPSIRFQLVTAAYLFGGRHRNIPNTQTLSPFRWADDDALRQTGGFLYESLSDATVGPASSMRWAPRDRCVASGSLASMSPSIRRKCIARPVGDTHAPKEFPLLTLAERYALSITHV